MQKTIELSPKQLQFLNRDERIGLLCAGLGFGKSFIGALYIVKKALENPGSVCVMASRDHGQLTIALDKEVQFVLHLMGLSEGKHFGRLKSPKLIYTFTNGSTLTGLSAQNYDSSFRGVNISFLLLDELAYYDEAAFLTSLGRVRNTPSQIRCVSTPKGYNFMYKYFVENKTSDSFVIYGTTYDNDLLPAEYAQSLKDSYTEKLYKQEVLASFVDLTSEQAYYQFNRDFHVSEVKKQREFGIYVGLDFNVMHMSGVFAQIIDDKVYVFDELYIEDEADTYKAAAIIKERYGTNVNIIPDSTGSNRSTVGPSNHVILRNAGFKIMNSRNPYIYDRVQLVNKLLEDRRIIISPKCKHLIRCLSQTSWGKNGKLDQISDRSLTHASDSLSYLCYRVFPPRSNEKLTIRAY